MSGKWARSSALLAVDQLIADLGGNVEAAFAHAGISVAALQQPELPLPAQAVVELFESAAEHCRCDSFGLQLACRQTLAVIGPLWQLAQCAPDIRTLLQQLEQFFQHVTSGAQVSLEHGSYGVALCYSLASGVNPRDRHTIELGLGLLCREIRRHYGPRWHPKAVQLRHAPPGDLDWHRQIFGTNLFFNQERNAVHFDQATLQQPLIDGKRQNQQLLQQLQQQAQPDIARQTEKLLRDMLPFFRCSLPVLAQALGCSTRGGIIFIKCLKAWALVHQRDYVIEDDIRALAQPVLHHRLIFRNREASRTALQQLVDQEVNRLAKMGIPAKP